MSGILSKFGEARLPGQQEGQAGFNVRPGQKIGQNRQRVPHVNHLDEPRTEKVRRRHGQIPQKSILPITIDEGFGAPLSGKESWIHAVCSSSAGPTK
jgi:hypothetical protein